MAICLLGQNHQTAPLELRELLAFNEEKQRRLSEMLRDDDLHREGVVLSTCNRMELYTVSASAEESRLRLGRYLEEIHGVEREKWERTLYFRGERDAVQHLFKVASGLDSMVLGEGQILAQVKDANGWAAENRTHGDILGRVFLDAISCGKRVRTDTKVGEGAISVAYAAVTLAKKIFTNLADQPVLLLGMGDTGRRVARHLHMFGVQDLRVSNRSRARAEELAHELDASLIPWEQFPQQLEHVGIVVSATSASDYVLTAEHVRTALAKSGRRTLFCIDLAVPRDIDPDVGKIPGVFLYNVDDLEGIAVDGEDRRRIEAVKAESIVNDQVDRYLDWYRARNVAPVVTELRTRVEKIRNAELRAARNGMPDEAYEILERVSARMMNKVLHEPTVSLKRSASRKDAEAALRHFREFFALDDESGRGE